MSCNCNNNTPQPCCQDCNPGPCTEGCLDFIGSSCIEHAPAMPSIGLGANSKLDVILENIDLSLASNTKDKLVKTSALDPVGGYLSDKLKVCQYLTKQTVTEGGQQKVELCLNLNTVLSGNAQNPVFMDTNGINLNYEKLIETIINTPELLQALCNAINNCTPD
jgi:hypothetical protein